jgi:hypothetical protein
MKVATGAGIQMMVAIQNNIVLVEYDGYLQATSFLIDCLILS